MAKTKPADDASATASAVAVTTMPATTDAAPAAAPITTAPATSVDVATPENTPVPGGGRWRWDITLPGWVEIDDTGNPVPVASPAAATPATTSE